MSGATSVRCPRCGREYWVDLDALRPIVGDDVANDEALLPDAVLAVASAIGVHPCRSRR